MTKKISKDIRTGVIGVGSMGQNHARIYNDISNFVSIADPNEEQGRRVAKRFGVDWHRDYRDMLSNVDAVTIAVPTSMHKEVAEEVSAAGVNMLVEKPLAATSVEAEAIVMAAEAAGVILAVGHVERHTPIITHAKKCIDNGDWGQILTFSAKRFSNYPSRVHDVGVLFDLTIHDVDVICFLYGNEVRTVYAIGGKSRNKQHEDHVNLMMEFEDGGIGLCETNWLTPMKVRQLNITTTKCYVNLNYLSQEIEIMSSKYGQIDESNLYDPSMKVSKKKISMKGREPLKSEIIDFIGAVEEGRRPLVTGEEALRAVQIVEAGLASINGATVINI